MVTVDLAVPPSDAPIRREAAAEPDHAAFHTDLVGVNDFTSKSDFAQYRSAS